MRTVAYRHLVIESWIEDAADKSFERFSILGRNETGEPLTPADKMNAKILLTRAELSGWGGRARKDRVAVIRPNVDASYRWWLDELLGDEWTVLSGG